MYRVLRSPSREVCCGGGAELVSCEDIALVPGPLGRSLRIHNLTWARGGEVEPGGLVYRTHRGEEAVLTRGRHTGRYSIYTNALADTPYTHIHMSQMLYAGQSVRPSVPLF